MKEFILAVIGTVVMTMLVHYTTPVHAQSDYNWNNSPYNYKNSEYNYNSRNGVYDNNGNRVGYQTVTPEGTKNYFDSNGNRVGYGR